MQAIATPMTQAMKEWTKIFPKNMTETYTSSVTFMKQLTVVAISTITYLKNFPEDSYTLEHFAGLKLRILKKKCRDEFADFVSTALTQAFEAFDKKYLHQLALCFYKDEFNKESLLEYHIFEYSYNKDGVTMSVHSKGRQTSKFTFDNVRDRTVQLIRACVVIMQSTQHNCDQYCDVSLRLYYNEDAPPGYNVSGFTAAGPEQDHIGDTLDAAIQLGAVQTPFHRLAASCYMRDETLASREAIPSQNAPIMTQVDDDDFEERQQESPAWDEGSRVRCPCHRRDDAANMLTCFYCNTRQHAACFGVSRDSVATHCCDRCAERDPGRSPTDKRLTDLPDKKRECMCIFRRTLEHCRPEHTMRGAELAARLQLSHMNTVKLLKLLHSHAIIDDVPQDLTVPKKINSEQLQDAISKFFQTSEDNLVERLLAETFASQESTPDPVGDVLEPMEKVSLQNADNLGRVIDNPVQPPVRQDSTLLQYREAVLSNYQRDDELPLSGSHNPVTDMENIGKKLGKRKLNDENQRPRLRSASHKTKRAKVA